MNFDTARKLIINNKIEEALQVLLDKGNPEIKNKITLLGSQYKAWESKDVMDIGAPIEERNRIVYEILTLTTEAEKTTVTGQKLKKLKNLATVEKELSATFEKISSLRSKGAIDLFMEWFRKTNPEAYNAVLIEEKNLGKATNLNTILSALNLNEFILEYGLNAPADQIQEYISRKNDEIPKFFHGWMDYNKQKNYKTKTLVNAIPEKFKKHKMLLSGVLGSFTGTLAFNIIENYLNDISEDDGPEESGMDDDDDD
ncbi:MULTISPECIES: hypothetical protein [Aquimarina]|uniref:hypothetical protein n=1 Tax=Aquimarina TaxID=290174 RepID=UPI000943CA64|nr:MULTISPECIES: hypothetical protein [Aquimarina]